MDKGFSYEKIIRFSVIIIVAFFIFVGLGIAISQPVYAVVVTKDSDIDETTFEAWEYMDEQVNSEDIQEYLDKTDEIIAQYQERQNEKQQAYYLARHVHFLLCVIVAAICVGIVFFLTVYNNKTGKHLGETRLSLSETRKGPEIPMNALTWKGQVQYFPDNNEGTVSKSLTLECIVWQDQRNGAYFISADITRPYIYKWGEKKKENPVIYPDLGYSCMLTESFQELQDLVNIGKETVDERISKRAYTAFIYGQSKCSK